MDEDGPADHSFFAVTARGLERVLAAELAGLGIQKPRPASGGVAFHGTLRDAYAACLWSRTAERVLLQVATFLATTREEVYEGSRSVDWTAHLSPIASFSCTAIGSTPAIRNSHFAALVLKDAVVDQFRDRLGQRPSVDPHHADVRLQLLLRDERAVVSVDLAGDALHRRGYRTPGRQADAPLKETLAAGVLLLAGWPQIAKAGGVLLDPLCGSATFVIEAGLMAADAAPSLGRTKWGFERWLGHEAQTWNDLLESAAARREIGFTALRERTRHMGRPPLAGSDRDPRVLTLARAALLRAGLAGMASLEIADVRDLRDPFPRTVPAGAARPGCPTGLLVTNPPYGGRLDAQDLDGLHAALGAALRRHLPGWRAAVLTAEGRRAAQLGMSVRADAPRLRNGPIRCTLLLCDIEGSDPAPQPSAAPTASLAGAADQLRNRLRRNARVVGRPLRRAGVDCFRIYDADLPDFNFAVDVYGDWIHVQEYQAPVAIDPGKAAARLAAGLEVTAQVLDLPADHVVVKRRRRQRHGSQYERIATREHYVEVHEGDATFLVNLTDRIDTGLFLDQRLVRTLIRSLASDAAFLNLFGYTGTATVAAALGGARRSLTVDLSRTYLEWAGRNFGVNRLDRRRHTLLRADVVAWLRQAPRQPRRYDLILLGPPTFSTSAGMGSATLDLQRDHVDLVRRAARLLTRGGTLLFVSGAHRFRFAADELAAYSPVDLSARTLPLDFSRRARWHHVWQLTFARPRRGAGSNAHRGA